MPKLFVSKPNLSCEDVIELMHFHNIMCNISTNKTIIPSSGSVKLPAVENGCTLNIHRREDVSLAWSALQFKFGFTCAYLDLAPTFQGCILDFVRPSNCPGFP